MSVGEIDKNVLEEEFESVLQIYPENGNHNRRHIINCLENLDLIVVSNPDIGGRELFKAKVGVILHDIEREARNPKELITGFGLKQEEAEDVLCAVADHGKPKYKWKNPDNLITQLVYDADKMDTSKERFLDPNKEGKYWAYVLMVRDSVTFRVARDKLTGELPQQLQINPFNQTVRAIEVDNFQKGLRGVWQHATLPARKTISKLILMCTRNNNYTKFIQEKLGSRPKTEELDGIGLSKLQRRLIARVEGMEGYVNYILEKLDPLTDKAEWSETDKEQLRLFLEEKLFTYDMFIRMLIGFDIKDMDDLERVYFRKKEKIRQNYERFRENTREIREGFDMEKLESRRQYFRELLGDKLESLSHFSRVNNVQALIGGRRLLDRQWGDILAEISVTNTTRAIDTALSVEKSSSQIPNLADKILRHFRQDALRAVDRVNDIFGTDRFIYFLLSGQTINSPVARLPYIYTMNKLPKTSKGLIINFSAPSHPQAIHAIKMFRDLAEMPTILEEGIKMFSKGLYLPDDFKKMVVDIFSLNFRQNEINQDMFDFIFNNLVVNEDGELKVKNENYVFSDWLEIDYEKRGNINWKMATQIVTRINHFCSKVGIISPLRPYVVMKKDLVVTELGISVMKNPASAIQ